MTEVLRLYPDNIIVWVHMGLSQELVNMNAAQHIQTMRSLLDRYPKLMLDIAWRVIEDSHFSNRTNELEAVRDSIRDYLIGAWHDAIVSDVLFKAFSTLPPARTYSPLSKAPWRKSSASGI